MTVDGELSIGGLEETATVSGAAPVVDVRTNARAEVLDRAILDAIPTDHNLQSTAQLIVGVKLNRPEVGLTTAAQQTFMAIHGMNPSQTTVRVDGNVVNSLNLDGAGQTYHNHLTHQEMAYETAGVSAETSGGGVRLNMIPREGGNAFSGQGYLGGSLDRCQADGLESLSPRSVERGVAGTEGIDFLYDLNVGQGGAIVRDELWFFGSFRNMQIDKKVTNSFHRETDVAQRFFDPAPVRLDGRDGRPRVPGIDENTVINPLLRLTHRADAVNKFSAYLDHGPLLDSRCVRRRGDRDAPVARDSVLHVDGHVDRGRQQPAALRGRLFGHRRQGQPRRPRRRPLDRSAAICFDPEIAFGARGGTHVGGPRGDYGTNGDDYVQDWEIGLPTVQDFGGRASRPVEDPDGVERAWVGVFSAGVQREILPGLSTGFTWYRRDSHDTILRVNRALGFADYTPLSIENPCAANPRAGFIGCSSRGVAAEPTLQVWNLDPARRGVTDWVVRNTTSDDDLYAEVYNGFESSFNASAERRQVQHPLPARVQAVRLRTVAGRHPGKRFRTALSGAGSGRRQDPRCVGRDAQRGRAGGRSPLQRQHRLYRAELGVRGPGAGTDPIVQRPAHAAGGALLRPADPDRPLRAVDVRPGERHALGAAGRHLQPHRRPADSQRQQRVRHHRRQSRKGIVHDSGPFLQVASHVHW